ncbi:MAG: hypothetical protein IKX23_08875 [Treponema sp.]|nr:hypothetical protein [Treponema sp.]
MKKLLVILTTFFIALSTAIAMPGFESYIPDIPGEFVYYRDYSFARESYIGLLKYDDSTYQIKYFAPFDTKNKLMEKNLALAVTVNPKSNFWDMTGEVILQAPQNNDEDIEILNYLHDILYEFSSRRIKAGKITPSSKGYIISGVYKNNGFAVTEKYDQFGGTVTTLYDVLIPLWNVKSIVDYTGKILFECVTFGRLSSNDDKSFDEFKGFGNLQNKGKVQKFKKSVPAKIKLSYTNSYIKLALDSNWKPANDFIYFLGDEANVTAYAIPFKGKNTNYNLLQTLRFNLEGSNKTYTDFSSIELINKNDDKSITKLSYKSYLPDSKNIIYTTRLINAKNNSEDINQFSISVNLNAYTKKKAYYDAIINSCSFGN